MEKTIIVEVVEPLGPTTFLRYFEIHREIDYLIVQVKMREEGNLSYLFLYDALGRIRAQLLAGAFKEVSTIVIHKKALYTSYGCSPGPLLGEWRMEILFVPLFTTTQRIEILLQGGWGKAPLNPTTLPFIRNSWIDEPPAPLFHKYPWKRAVKSEKGWRSGDFHTHTTASDGKLSVEELTSLAKERGLDFYALTEHNLYHTGLPEGDLLVIPGMEVTGSKGHFNILGCREWIDWSYSCKDGGCESEEGMNRILLEAKESLALNSMNHPFLEPWAWLFKETEIGLIHCLEIINDPTYPGNREATERAITFLDVLWEDGHRIWGIGGSDCHLRPTERNPQAKEPSIIGDPLTYVLADSLSAEGILEGVFKGKVYVTRGPCIDFKVFVGQEEFYPGSQLPVHSKNIEVYAKVWKARGKTLSVILCGKEILRESIEESSFREKLELDDDYCWIRLEIRGKEDAILAATNPIFKGKREPLLVTYGEALERMEQKEGAVL